MAGGLIHDYLGRDLAAARNPKYYTDRERLILSALKLNKNAKLVPIGSFTFPIQKYPSDIDVNAFVTIASARTFVKDLQKLVKRLTSREAAARGIFFSDFKAGDAGGGEGIHWTAPEILAGKNVHGRLLDAVQQKSIVKLDIIAISDRAVEASAFFLLMYPDGKFVNIPEDFYATYADNLRADARAYWKDKPFKSIKRMWSLGRLSGSKKLLLALAPAIDSNLSVLGQVASDSETLALLMLAVEQKRIQWTKSLAARVRACVDGFLRRMSNVADINIGADVMDLALSMRGAPSATGFAKLSEVVAALLKKETHEWAKSAGISPSV